MRTGTYELLKGCQVVRGQRTFISKWSIITRMTGWCKSDQEFAFASIQICWQLLPEKQPKEFSRSFSKLNMVSLSRDGLKEVCNFFSFLLDLLGQLTSEHKLSNEDPLANMYHGYQQDFLDCERFAARAHVSQGTMGVVQNTLQFLVPAVLNVNQKSQELGRTEARRIFFYDRSFDFPQGLLPAHCLGILQLLESLSQGKHDGILWQVLSSHPTSSLQTRLEDSRLAKVLKPAVDVWLAYKGSDEPQCFLHIGLCGGWEGVGMLMFCYVAPVV